MTEEGTSCELEVAGCGYKLRVPGWDTRNPQPVTRKFSFTLLTRDSFVRRE
jgi:hypothetical protein